MKVVIPARHGKAFHLAPGDRIAITTPNGTQVGDVWALRAGNPLEYLSMEHTRSRNSNIYVQQGTLLVSNHRRPMLRVVADTSPGRHDTQLCPCNAEIYQELGVSGPHRSCTDNFHEALAEVGLALPFTPASLNIFMKVPIDAAGDVQRCPPDCKPGDTITFQADMALTVVVSACPQDITPINGADCIPGDLVARISRA
jgi:uncharacterized protein YcgI (DUF1989 family)